jgi:hypothetical protein
MPDERETKLPNVRLEENGKLLVQGTEKTGKLMAQGKQELATKADRKGGLI